VALWSIVRIANAPEGAVTVDCSDPDVATQVTLRDLDTGLEESVQMCWRPTEGNLCHNLDALAVTYTPNDWGDDCP
jgi:hypothetical protein